MKKNILFIPLENTPKASKVSLSAKQFYLTISFMFVFFLSLTLFLVWSYQSQEIQKNQMKQAEKILEQHSNKIKNTTLSLKPPVKNAPSLFSNLPAFNFFTHFEGLKKDKDIWYWNHLRTLNHQFYSASFLRLDHSIATAPKNIHFPYSYTITGYADTSYTHLAQMFYGDTTDAEYLANENHDQLDTPLKKGDQVTIYPPNIYPSLTIYDSYMDIPHLLHQENKIIEPDGQILGTPEEIEFFVRVVVAESDPKWTYEGFRMIAESIANRIRLTGHSIWEVLTAEKQYDVVSGYNYLRVKVSPIHRQAALDALKEKQNKYLPNDVIFFATEEAVHRTPWFKQQKLFKSYYGVMFFSPGNGETLEEVLKILEKFQPLPSQNTDENHPIEESEIDASLESESNETDGESLEHTPIRFPFPLG